jgi:hypothetical protein
VEGKRKERRKLDPTLSWRAEISFVDRIHHSDRGKMKRHGRAFCKREQREQAKKHKKKAC